MLNPKPRLLPGAELEMQQLAVVARQWGADEGSRFRVEGLGFWV